jgi:hypothetical protein
MKRTKNELILFDVLFFLLVVLISSLVLVDEITTCLIDAISLEKLFYSVTLMQVVILFAILFYGRK